MHAILVGLYCYLTFHYMCWSHWSVITLSGFTTRPVCRRTSDLCRSTQSVLKSLLLTVMVSALTDGDGGERGLAPASPGSLSPHVQPENGRFYLTSHLKWFTGTNGQIINILTYWTVKSCWFIFFLFYFVFSFCFVFSPHIYPINRTNTHPAFLYGTWHEHGMTLWTCGVAIELQCKTVIADNDGSELGHQWKPFWPSQVRPTKSCKQQNLINKKSTGLDRGCGFITVEEKGSGNVGS